MAQRLFEPTDAAGVAAVYALFLAAWLKH